MKSLSLRNPNNTDLPLSFLKHQIDFAYSPAHTTFLASGWAGGKSVAGVNFCFVSAMINRGCTGLIVLPTYKMQREFLNSLLVPMMRDFIVEYSTKDGVLYLRDGGRIVCLSGHNVEFIEQYTASWAYADEVGLMNRRLFMKLSGRIREEKGIRRRIGFTGTPTWGWLKEEFEHKNDKHRRIIHARTTDNPYLPADFLENLYSSCPSRLAKAYIEGQFVPPGGNVYAEFDAEEHVIDWKYDARLPTILSIDWAARVPHAVFFQMIPENSVINGRVLKKMKQSHDYAGAVVLDEVVLDGTYTAITREVLCQEIVRRGYAPRYFVCDPAGDAAQSASTITDLRRAREMLGIDARTPKSTAQRNIQNGVSHVQNMLMPLDKVPRLYFAKDMMDRANTLAQHVRGRASINAIMSYAYPEDNTSSQPVKDGVSDHFCDCVRYFVVLHFPADRILSSVRQAS